MAEAPTVAERPAEPPPPLQGASAPAAGEGGGGGNVPDFSANIETTTDTAPAPHQLPPDDAKTARDAKLAAARAKSEERRIAHAKLKQHMRDTAIPIRPQPDEHQ